MPQKCSICTHKKRAAIEAALLQGITCRKIAQQFKVGQWAIYGHQKNHVAAQLQKAREAQDVEAGNTLVARLLEIHQETRSILTRALAKNDGELALKAISRLEKQLELEGRLLGELEDRGTTLQKIEVVYVDKMLVTSVAAQQAFGPSPQEALPTAGERLDRPLLRLGGAERT